MSRSVFVQAASLFVGTAISFSAHADFLGWLQKKTDELSKGATTTYYKAVTSPRICAANEVKDWFVKDVIPAFQQKDGLTVRPENLVFDGSEKLVANWNNNNSDRCDLIVLGSDVAALRGTDFSKTSRVELAYSPIVIVGQKDRLDAARAFLKKSPGDKLSCPELAEVSAQGRLGRIKPGGGTKKINLEMSISNSGQSAYVSCVYSEFDAVEPKEVVEGLVKTDGKEKEDRIKKFMGQVIFEQPSSSKVKDLFINDANGVGGGHLAIFTYESYVKEIKQKAAVNQTEIEVLYPAISVLNNFPAQILAAEGTNENTAAKSFLQVAKSKAMQSKLVGYGLRPTLADIALDRDYMKADIDVGESPRNRGDLHQLWDVVGRIQTPYAPAIAEIQNFAR